jgi:hypothetical protein
MRVAFHIGNPLTDGVAAIALSWVKQLAVQFPSACIIVLTDSPPEGKLDQRVGWELLPQPYRFFSFWSHIVLYRKLLAFKPDLLVHTLPEPRLISRWKQVRVSSKASFVTRTSLASFLPLSFSQVSILSAEEKHKIKEQWSFGREFFMLTGPLPSEAQLTLLLQAFSLFKNRQQSGLKLVLPFSLSTHYPALAQKIDQYKYRSSLIVTETLSPIQTLQLAGAAYALVVLATPGSSLIACMQAWQVGVPLLALQDEELLSAAGESVLYAASETKEAFAAIMMQIYKDEALRLQLIRNGQQVVSGLDQRAITTALYEQLQQFIQGSIEPVAY